MNKSYSLPLAYGLFFNHQCIICEPLVRHPREPYVNPACSFIGTSPHIHVYWNHMFHYDLAPLALLLCWAFLCDPLCGPLRLALSLLGMTLNILPLLLYTILSSYTTCWVENKRYQKNYIKIVLEKFYMQYAKPISTPLAKHFRLFDSLCLKEEKEIEYMLKVPYTSRTISTIEATKEALWLKS